MKAYFLALAVLATVPPGLAGGGSCHRVHAFNPERVAKLDRIQKELEAIDPARFRQVFIGEDKPNWNDYNILAQLIENLQNPSLRIDTATESNDLKSLHRSLHELTAFELKQKLSSEFNFNNHQRFLDFHIAYFHLIKKINGLLKAPVLPEPDLSQLQTDHQLIAEAEALIKSVEDRAEATMTQTGHANYEEYKAYTSAHSEASQKLLKMTESELVVAMHRPTAARFWIPIAGFQNQRVTGSSKGAMFGDTSSPSGRDKAEAKMTGSDLDSFFAKSPRFKPNYAEARPEAQSTEFKPNQGADQYGSDLWIFKKHRIEKRTTFTMKDSLLLGQAMSGKLAGLQDMAIPWKYRSLMIPFTKALSYPEVNVFSPYSFKAPSFKMNVSLSAINYFEVQVWGPLHIDDVKAFHFKTTPPDKKFYELLISKEIEVWDERNWPAVRYSGAESI